jgi:chromosome segregation ATPase
MPAGPQHTHRVKLQESELDLGADPYSRITGEDFDGKLRQAQQQLEILQHQREALERKKIELDDLNRRKEEFVNGQIEITERLAGSLTSIDRELFELRQELEDLEQTRQSFAAHLHRIEKIEPESWPRDALSAELNRALVMLDQAEEEFDSAVAHFAGGRVRGIFGNSGAKGIKGRTGGDFVTTMKNGIAFNLPVIVLGGIALLLYLFK